ncbi:hypothetical protein M3Y96_00230200 [Aphelenchoides besseyi]|nr:hypothetical protein M3Y96_00230200 [Aphelenchoides besseyi]
MAKTRDGNFDEPLPELPFIGICNRVSCGDLFRAFDEFRKSELFSNFQTAMSLLNDEKGLEIIGEMLEKPELISNFVGSNGVDENKPDKLKKDEITSEDGDFGVDFSSLVDGQPSSVTKEEKGKPIISANLDYYTAARNETWKGDEEVVPDHIDVEVEETIPNKTDVVVPLPEISESIDEIPQEFEVLTVQKTVDLPIPVEEKASRTSPTALHISQLPQAFVSTTSSPLTSYSTTTRPTTTRSVFYTTTKQNFRVKDDYYSIYYDT